MEKLKLYIFRDEYGSIIAMDSSYFLEDDPSYEVFIEVDENDPDYELVKHARGQEYARKKFGQYLLDVNLRPNYYKNFEYRPEEEKKEKYPIVEVEEQPSELELLKERQDRTEQALQDLIIATMSM